MNIWQQFCITWARDSFVPHCPKFHVPQDSPKFSLGATIMHHSYKKRHSPQPHKGNDSHKSSFFIISATWLPPRCVWCAWPRSLPKRMNLVGRPHACRVSCCVEVFAILKETAPAQSSIKARSLLGASFFRSSALRTHRIGRGWSRVNSTRELLSRYISPTKSLLVTKAAVKQMC